MLCPKGNAKEYASDAMSRFPSVMLTGGFFCLFILLDVTAVFPRRSMMSDSRQITEDQIQQLIKGYQNSSTLKVSELESKPHGK